MFSSPEMMETALCGWNNKRKIKVFADRHCLPRKKKQTPNYFQAEVVPNLSLAKKQTYHCSEQPFLKKKTKKQNPKTPQHMFANEPVYLQSTTNWSFYNIPHLFSSLLFPSPKEHTARERTMSSGLCFLLWISLLHRYSFLRNVQPHDFQVEYHNNCCIMASYNDYMMTWLFLLVWAWSLDKQLICVGHTF